MAMDSKALHPSSRILIIALAGLAIYLAAVSAISAAAPPFGRGWPPMMGGMMGYLTTGSIVENGISIGLGLFGMLILSLFLFWPKPVQSGAGEGASPVQAAAQANAGRPDEFEIMKRALTADERLLLETVRSAPDGITQDSLRFRLDWSKAKVSTMLSYLDRMGLVQRERFGKTFKVHYQEGKTSETNVPD